MKYIKKIVIVFIIALTFVVAAKAQVLDKVIAKVDNQILLQSELDIAFIQSIGQIPPSKEYNAHDLKCKVLESLLINKLMLAKAEIDSVVVDPEMVNSQLDKRMDYFIKMAGSAEKLEKLYKKPIDQLKDELKKSLKDQLVIQKMQEHITGSITITPEEVKKFFNAIPKDSLPYFSTTVEVGQIVKIPTIGTTEKNKTRALLAHLRQQIENGADFCKLAKEYSQDPGSKDSCGELGFFKRGELVPEYEAAALKLEPGEISEPIESEYGFHLIQLIERRSNSYNTRHILIKPISTEKDFGYAQNFLDSIRTLILKDSTSFPKAANQFSDDKKTKPTGGFFTDEKSSYRVSIKDLDPVLFFTIDTMKVGEISHPIKFKTSSGEEAMRIVYLKEKSRPHIANLEEDYQDIYTAALEHKKNTTLNEWFDKTKDEVYIHIDDDYLDCNILLNP